MEDDRYDVPFLHTLFVYPCNYDPCPLNEQHRCGFWHKGEAWRRNPYEVCYSPDECPGRKMGDTELECEDMQECPFSHSFREVAFHPRNYKTQMCEDMERCENVQDTRYCPYAHSRTELVGEDEAERRAFYCYERPAYYRNKKRLARPAHERETAETEAEAEAQDAGEAPMEE